MNEEKNEQIRKKQPSFIRVTRSPVLDHNFSPAVILKRIKFSHAEDRSFLQDSLPELDDEYESTDVNPANEASNQERLEGEDSRTGEELSLIETMTSEELNAHIQKCLEMSSENKITPKNAFALQLIDCMNFLVKKQRDFSAVACTLDAGAKIYSNRVDALYQQVVKLAEEVIHSHKNKEVEKEDKGRRLTKEYRRTSKKNVIASFESLSRKRKLKDPRDRFIKLDALPGEIQRRVRRDAKDLSFTLENNVPFWQNWEDYVPLKAEGTVMLPEFKVFRDIKKMNDEGQEFLDSIENQSISTTTNTDTFVLNANQELPNSISSMVEPIPIPEDTPMEDQDYDDNDHDVLYSSLGDETKSDEVDVILTATKRLQEEAESGGALNGVPSRFEVMKMVFSRVSDYHYLQMKNAYYWAGPEFWKRPKGGQKINEKIIVPKKKRDPKEISYSDHEIDVKWAKFMKKKSNLTQKTVMKWKNNKFTLPRDLKLEKSSILNLFHISTAFNERVEESHKLTTWNTTRNNEVNSCNIASAQYRNSQELMDHSGSQSQDSMNESFFENAPSQFETQDENGLKSSFFGVGLMDRPEQLSNNKCYMGGVGKVIKVQMSSSETPTFDETTMVPLPKIVTFEPIKYSTRPIRVDMQHLKQTMLEVMKEQIERNAQENDHPGSDDFSMDIDFTPETRFSAILKKLPEVLQKTTATDLTPQIAFLALLTLANENNLQLKNCDDYSDVIVRLEDKSKAV